MGVEYPKALYLRRWDDLAACVTVQDVGQEQDARAEGYRTLAEPVAKAETGDDAPYALKRRGRPFKVIQT